MQVEVTQQPEGTPKRRSKRTHTRSLPAVLKDETKAAATLIAHLRAFEGESGDHELVRDMVEGETGLIEAIEAALKAIGDDEAMITANKDYRDQLKARADRIKNRVEAYKAALVNAMETVFDGADDTARKSIETAIATVTLRDGGDEVVIDDETAVPHEFWRVPEPELDKAAIREKLKEIARLNEGKPEEEQEKVAWARLASKGKTIAIRRM